MKNAMSSLVAGAFGLGNLVGTMAGGILATFLGPTGCMVYLTNNGLSPKYKEHLNDDIKTNFQLDLNRTMYADYW